MNKDFYIISAWLKDASLDQNFEATNKLQLELCMLGVLPVVCVGSWKGNQEISFQIPSTACNDTFMRYLCEKYSQEAYLHVYYTRAAYVIPQVGVPTRIGTWNKVDNVTNLEAWTKIGDEYYAA